nr:dTDP-glucose 4,6-dehydratase [Rhodopirellula sp. JC639]
MVTGGCGFIGSNLVRHLLTATPHCVVNVDKLTYAGNPNSLAEIANDPRYVFVRGDIADLTLMRGVFAEHAPDAVMHLAAESHVDRSIDGPADFIQTNVVGTFHLLSAASEYSQELSGPRADSFRFLHVSTDEVYGALGDEGLFSESTAYDPHSPYAATKASSDHLARAWRTTYGLPVIVTNCSNNYGPYQFPEKLIPLMIIKAIGEQPLPVYGHGENVRDWLHVADHASALCQVLQLGEVGQTYNIGGDCQRRNIDLVRAVCEILDELHPRPSGCHADLIRFVADRPGHDFRYAIDSTKIRQRLGWQPQHDLQSGLRQTVRWYLDNRDWWQAILAGNYQLQRLGRVQSTDQS